MPILPRRHFAKTAQKALGSPVSQISLQDGQVPFCGDSFFIIHLGSNFILFYYPS